MRTPVLQMAALLAVAALLVVSPSSDAQTPSPESGLYEVEGITTVVSTGEKRVAHGKVVLVREGGERCTMAIDLQTTVERDGVKQKVDLTGDCACEMIGAYLSGTCETRWLLSATPADLDPKLEPMPGRLGPPVQSSFEMKPEGRSDRWRVEVSSKAEAEEYPPTVSLLNAVRAGDAPIE